MREIFHIFKKDVRRHWPEILVSLAFLGLYVKVTLRSPGRTAVLAGNFSWFWLSAESLPALMVVFWIFLTVRVVQGEPLVGDRQWWVTKPYEWWKLLAAKQLFLLAFVSFPLLVVQVFLLHHAGFPIFANVLRILYMQFSLAIILFLPSVALGSLTRTLWQAVLAVVLGLVLVPGVINLIERIPNINMSSAADDWMGEVTGILFLASVVGATGWQYSRRKTWASRGVLLIGPALAALLAAVMPYAKFVEKKYPLAEVKAARAHFAPVIPTTPANRKTNPYYDTSSVYLRIPLVVSGIPAGHVVRIDGVRPLVGEPGSPKWDPGWNSQWTQVWPENQQTDLNYEMKRKDFDSIKTHLVRLHLELALTEYEETAPRELTLKEGKFLDPMLGTCHLGERIPSGINCIRPFNEPGLIATFDPSTAGCEDTGDDQQIPENRISHFWFPPHDEDFTSTMLNPVVDYSIDFRSSSWWMPTGDGANRKVKRVYLCPGAEVRLAKPKEIGHMRVQLDLEGVHLENLANNPEFDWNQ
jgi:hypothetical protein